MDFIGRTDPVRKITAWLGGDGLKTPASVVSISGSGGIGKTYLLEHALGERDMTARGYLRLRLAGKAEKRTLGQLICEDLVQSCAQIDPAGQGYFVETRKNLEALRFIEDSVRAEVEAAVKGDAELRQTIHEVFKLGAGLQAAFPILLKSYVDLTKLKPQHVDTVLDLMARAQAYKQESRFLGGAFPLPDLLNRGRRNRLRAGMPGAIADGLVSDLSAILSRYMSQDRAKPMPTKVPGLDRLLLIVDDYESLSDVLGTFLTDHLLPRLAGATFETLLIVLGRDRLSDTHTAWRQRHDALFIEELRLTAFTPAEAEAYVLGRGIAEDAIVRRILEETAGYPYLLAGEVDAELDGGRTALGLKLFYDRTTLWMTPEQKAWLLPLCFLDEINEDTIVAVLPGDDVKRVLEWFQSEASVRSPRAVKWEILPIIRSRLLALLRLNSPKRYRELEERAASAHASHS